MSQRTRRFLPARSLAGACVAAALACGAIAPAHAAEPPRNWWVYLHNDNAADLRKLLAQGADPNVRYKNGQPALMRAVVDGAWQVFDLLAADPRTDLEAVNPANETALMYLAVAGQMQRASELIARGAKVNRLGWTPLHYAASKGHVDTARLLLKHEAMVNAPSPDGTTPLMMAALSGNRDMVQLLLDSGADITTRNLKGQNVVDWARQGKAGKLAAELTTLVAAAEQRRQSLRGGQPADAPERAASGNTAATVVAPPAPAPAQTGQATESDSPTLSGVSGVRLNKY